jgi:hypothetical protein
MTQKTKPSPLLDSENPDEASKQIADVERRIAEINAAREEARHKAAEEEAARQQEEQEAQAWIERNADEISRKKRDVVERAARDADDVCDVAMERLRTDLLTLEAPGRALVEAERARRKAHRAARRVCDEVGLATTLPSCPQLDVNGGFPFFVNGMLCRLIMEGQLQFTMDQEYQKLDPEEVLYVPKGATFTVR